MHLLSLKCVRMLPINKFPKYTFLNGLRMCILQTDCWLICQCPEVHCMVVDYSYIPVNIVEHWPEHLVLNWLCQHAITYTPFPRRNRDYPQTKLIRISEKWLGNFPIHISGVCSLRWTVTFETSCSLLSSGLYILSYMLIQLLPIHKWLVIFWRISHKHGTIWYN